MAGAVEGDGDAGVAEAFADDLGVHAGGENEAGAGVAQVVGGEGGYVEAAQRLLEESVDAFGVQGPAVFAGEDVAAVGVGGSPGEAFLELVASPGAQRGDGAVVDVDGAAAAAGFGSVLVDVRWRCRSGSCRAQRRAERAGHVGCTWARFRWLPLGGRRRWPRRTRSTPRWPRRDLRPARAPPASRGPRRRGSRPGGHRQPGHPGQLPAPAVARRGDPLGGGRRRRRSGPPGGRRRRRRAGRPDRRCHRRGVAVGESRIAELAPARSSEERASSPATPSPGPVPPRHGRRDGSTSLERHRIPRLGDASRAGSGCRARVALRSGPGGVNSRPPRRGCWRRGVGWWWRRPRWRRCRWTGTPGRGAADGDEGGDGRWWRGGGGRRWHRQEVRGGPRPGCRGRTRGQHAVSTHRVGVGAVVAVRRHGPVFVSTCQTGSLAGP